MIGITDMFAHPFMRHAFLGGTAVALAAGVVGYFVVLRGQVFAGDALSHVAFAGALGALVIGVDVRVGLFVSTIVVGVALAMLGRRGRPDDVVTGNVFAWILGIGVLFLAWYTTRRSAGNGAAGVNVLFGSILGLSASEAKVAAVTGAMIVLVVIAIGRPLLFTSIDEAVAGARHVPVRALGVVFLAVLGATAAEATQAVGALLLLGLLTAPAGAAQRLTPNPYRAMALSGLFAVVAMWGGLTISYLAARVPPSFAIIGLATMIYLGAFGVTEVRSRWVAARSGVVRSVRPRPASPA